MKFRAAVLNKVNGPMTLDTLEMAPLSPTDVLVKVKASGLCHTDLEVIQGLLAYPLPIVLGHEGAGVVEAVGRDVIRVKVGDHVICSWNPHCGHCFYCERDLPILCEPFARNQPKGFLLDGRSRMKRDGDRVHHYSVTSTHAEYTVVPESGAIPIPREVPFDRACMIGCGAVGLNVLQGAKLSDAGRIIAVDVDKAKLDRAAQFGATHTVDGSVGNAPDQIKALTDGRGADYVFEAAGNKSAFRLSVEAVRPGGQVVWLGKINVNEEVSFRWGSLMGEKRFVRSSYGDARPRRDFPWIADEYLKGKLKLDELITNRIRLDQINEGFAALARGEGIRTVVIFD